MRPGRGHTRPPDEVILRASQKEAQANRGPCPRGQQDAQDNLAHADQEQDVRRCQEEPLPGQAEESYGRTLGKPAADPLRLLADAMRRFPKASRFQSIGHALPGGSAPRTPGRDKMTRLGRSDPYRICPFCTLGMFMRIQSIHETADQTQKLDKRGVD